ncbi:hypothetical protein [Streptomyces sp. NPDC001820]|uniref:hypothetical protein n=1 Tax=Streptomyces sp. NPDC001820 TaxID=3364613 RepID=UPI0036C38C8C
MQDEHSALTVSANESTSIAAQLRFARQLVAAATAYAVAVETYAAAHSAPDAAREETATCLPATSSTP